MLGSCRHCGSGLAVLGVKSNTLIILAVALLCPLMMIVMMPSMMGGAAEDPTGHGCEHDPTRTQDRDQAASRGRP